MSLGQAPGSCSCAGATSVDDLIIRWPRTSVKSFGVIFWLESSHVSTYTLAMAYEVQIQRRAARTLSRIDGPVRRRLIAQIDALSTDPRPQGAIPMSGVDAWRVRVGDYRIIYTISDTVLLVMVVEIGHRRDVYRRM